MSKLQRVAFMLLFVSAGTASAPSVWAQASAPPPSGDPAEEIQNAHRALQKTADSLSSPASGLAALAESGLPDPSSLPPGPAREALLLMRNPAIQGLLEGFKNPAFLKLVEAIWTSPRRHLLLPAQFGVVLLMAVVGIFRRRNSPGVLKRLWIGSSNWALGAALSALVVPVVAVGPSWFELLAGLATQVNPGAVVKTAVAGTAALATRQLAAASPPIPETTPPTASAPVASVEPTPAPSVPPGGTSSAPAPTKTPQIIKILKSNPADQIAE